MSRLPPRLPLAQQSRQAFRRALRAAALSWVVTLTLIFMDMTPALLKLLTPHSDYNHLVKAEIRENRARIDELGDRNYRLAMENPEIPELSVSEKFTRVRYSPVSNTREFKFGNRR